MPQEKDVLHVLVQHGVRSALIKQAERENRTLANLVETILLDHVKMRSRVMDRIHRNTGKRK